MPFIGANYQQSLSCRSSNESKMKIYRLEATRCSFTCHQLIWAVDYESSPYRCGLNGELFDIWEVWIKFWWSKRLQQRMLSIMHGMTHLDCEARGEFIHFFDFFFWRSKRAALLAWEKVEIDNLMSWLSTLGGAFSALGDSFGRCVSCGFLIGGLWEHSRNSIGWSFQADIAGKISIYQWKIGMRSGDPAVISRCKLYYSISLIQKGRLKAAKYLVLQEYEKAKKEREIGGDERLYKMCHGIWLKLQYSYFLRKQKRLTEHWMRVIHCCVELLKFFTK